MVASASSNDSNDSMRVKRRVNKTNSCPKHCWMYGRHSVCRYGWYPALVAPFLTMACLLSLYSSGGCDFIKVHVGFTPQPNMGWNESDASLGFWYYGEEDAVHDFDYVPIYGGCEWYQDGFDEIFIQKDRTWTVARIMAMVAGGASTVAAILSWLYVFTPLPTGFLWPVLFLPVVMIAFIAEGSKFLLFDIGVCRTSVWLPSGVNSLPQTAEYCELGESAYFAIASGAFLLVGLLLVCVNVPRERELDPHFGTVEDYDVEGDTDDHQENSDHAYEDLDDVMDTIEEPTLSAARHESMPDTERITVNGDDVTEDKLLRQADVGTTEMGGSLTKANGEDNEDAEADKPSESRRNTLATMEKSQQEESGFGSTLLEKLVNDLNCSYQTATKSAE
mmetsp:Transcript_1775/g.3421  ORF Transcript_1775/g.3421 Transcript_1775/m.3421 type:complete len:391 (-) Transcript_1775:46-1218(-)